MKKCNKLVALFLIAAIVFSVCQIAFAESCNPRDMVMGLGIMGVPDNQSIVSRGEFSKYLAEIISDDYSGVSSKGFSDLKAGDEFYEEVGIMQTYGILNGDVDGNVHAERPVTFNEAVKMLVCLLGYQAYANEKGGYPVGYLTVAQEIKLLKGVAMRGNGWLEESEAAHLIYNAFSVPLLSLAVLGADGSVTYTRSGDKMLLSYYRGLTRGEGVVTAVSGVDGTSNAKTGENLLCIDGVQYRYSSKIKDLLGYYVEFYFDDDKNIEVLVPTSNNETIKVSLSSVTVSADGFTYYNENDKKDKIGLEKDTEIYYNNAILNSLYDMSLTGQEGYITAIDHNDNGNAEYIFIDVYRDILVGAVDTDKKEVYDAYKVNNNLRIVNLGDYVDNVIITNDFGTEMSFNDIMPEQLYTISESIDKKTVYMHYNEEEAAGTVEAVITDGTAPKLVIGGVEYETSNYFNDNYSVSVSQSGRFLLNRFGQIAAFLPESKLKFGYITAGSYTKSMSPEYKLKILTEDNEFKIFVVADKVDCDDTGVKKETKRFYEDIICEGGTGVVPKLVRYKTNADGKINYVETADSRSGNYLNKLYTLSSATYVSASKIFGGKITADSSTKLFVVPKSGTAMDDIDYRVLPATEYLQSSTAYNALAYRTNTDSHHAEALILEIDIQSVAYTSRSPVAVFDNIVYRVDDDGNQRPYMNVYVGTTQRVVPVHDESVLRNILDENGTQHTLKKGDVIRYATTLRGNVATITLMYNRETQMHVSSQTGGSWNSTFHYNIGYVYDITDGNIWLCSSKPTGTVAIGDLMSYEAEDIIIYDSATDKLSIGGVNDINDYTHMGNPSKIFIHCRDSDTQLIFTVR